jgi:hypothetical protein
VLGAGQLELQAFSVHASWPSDVHVHVLQPSLDGMVCPGVQPDELQSGSIDGMQSHDVPVMSQTHVLQFPDIVSPGAHSVPEPQFGSPLHA